MFAPDRVTYSEYKRDTGAVMIIAYAPIKIKGSFWGGVLTAYNVVDINKKTWGIISIIIGAIIAGSLCVFLIIDILIRKSLKPIKSITETLINISRGDFSRKVEMSSDDEIGVIADNLNKMIDRSRETLDYVKKAATTLATSSEELTSTSVNLSSSSADQATSVQDISVELNLVLDSIKETTEYISDQVDSIGHTVESVTSLEDMSKKIAENMKIVKSQSDDSINISKEGERLVISATQTMHRIVESSKKITNIVTMINDVSEQINLLSLNASIEAARAGDSGKGFAVVAEEVGKLADNTSRQVKEIHSLSVEIENNVSEGNLMVNDIRSTISAIMDNIADNSRLIEEITDHTGSQADNHNTIKQVMKDLEEKARSIIDVAHFQQSNSESMKKAMQQILDFTTETATGAEEISASSEELSGRAEDLNVLVDSFKTFGKSEKLKRLDN
jgi:methyl-accepting chemotaxis protein